jgi:hypothetical protein
MSWTVLRKREKAFRCTEEILRGKSQPIDHCLKAVRQLLQLPHRPSSTTPPEVTEPAPGGLGSRAFVTCEFSVELLE